MASTITYSQVNWVPTFMGEKYEKWAIQMRLIFVSQDLWELVSEGYDQQKMKPKSHLGMK